MSHSIVREAVRVFCVIALIAAASGCGSSTGTVTGKVLYKGKALSNAQVNFVPTQGYPVATVTKADGTYSISGVAYGSSKVTVVNFDTGATVEQEEESNARLAIVQSGGGEREYQARLRGKPRRKLSGPPLPGQYRHPQSSPLVHNVTSRASTFDITLAD